MARARARVMAPRARKVVNYSWAGQAIIPTTVPALSKILMGTFVLSTAFDETLVRTRGILSVTSDASVTVERQFGGWGIIRVSESAAAIGITAIPSPIFNSDDDGWVVWVPFAQQSSFSVGAGGQGFLYQVDSKAQRILREGQVFAVVVENADVLHGLSIIQNIRVLARFRS